ncbi:Hint domain-containing protein [Palleronia salina]|uniref:Hint domain-containing protein n=1 Tax=Palleronia salina TaxID=313368 RepID=A0A1M6I885_9RHOB|nr:Hint domain-containing protein [Palleronia salina]SHJ30674.1 Hint domain-containing protein [Palleronia salina]
MTLLSAIEQDPAQSLVIYPAQSFIAVDGANLGDPLSVADDLILGDTYALMRGAEPVRLSVSHRPGQMVVAPGTEAGLVGADLHLDCLATFMSTDGTAVETLVIVELNRDRCTIAQVYLFPLAPLASRRDYTLVTVDRDAAAARFAEAACVSFTRGTHITMANGRQVPIEELRVGDPVLTRDHGVQQVRWVGTRTVRAIGAFAPIRIAKGVLHNENDLIVSPNHRLFVYQRQDRAGVGRAEVLVKAKYLVNGDTVTRTDGGFVEYYQLLFDRHEIIYAEGIAAETLLVDTRTRNALPEAVASHAGEGLPPAAELDEHGTRTPISVDTLRRASAC